MSPEIYIYIYTYIKPTTISSLTVFLGGGGGGGSAWIYDFWPNKYIPNKHDYLDTRGRHRLMPKEYSAAPLSATVGV